MQIQIAAGDSYIQLVPSTQAKADVQGRQCSWPPVSQMSKVLHSAKPSQAIPVIRPLLTIPAKRGSLAQVLEGLMSERSSSIGEPMKFVEFALKKLRRLLVPPQDLETGWLGLTRTVVFWILDALLLASKRMDGTIPWDGHSH